MIFKTEKPDLISVNSMMAYSWLPVEDLRDVLGDRELGLVEFVDLKGLPLEEKAAHTTHAVRNSIHRELLCRMVEFLVPNPRCQSSKLLRIARTRILRPGMGQIEKMMEAGDRAANSGSKELEVSSLCCYGSAEMAARWLVREVAGNPEKEQGMLNVLRCFVYEVEVEGSVEIRHGRSSMILYILAAVGAVTLLAALGLLVHWLHDHTPKS